MRIILELLRDIIKLKYRKLGLFVCYCGGNVRLKSFILFFKGYLVRK